jgi:hypothetical protein
MLSSVLVRLWHAPSFILAPGPRPVPTLFPTGPVKVSQLADCFLYLKPIPPTAYSKYKRLKLGGGQVYDLSSD